MGLTLEAGDDALARGIDLAVIEKNNEEHGKGEDDGGKEEKDRLEEGAAWRILAIEIREGEKIDEDGGDDRIEDTVDGLFEEDNESEFVWDLHDRSVEKIDEGGTEEDPEEGIGEDELSFPAMMEGGDEGNFEGEDNEGIGVAVELESDEGSGDGDEEGGGGAEGCEGDEGESGAEDKFDGIAYREIEDIACDAEGNEGGEEEIFPVFAGHVDLVVMLGIYG